MAATASATDTLPHVAFEACGTVVVLASCCFLPIRCRLLACQQFALHKGHTHAFKLSAHRWVHFIYFSAFTFFPPPLSLDLHAICVEALCVAHATFARRCHLMWVCGLSWVIFSWCASHWLEPQTDFILPLLLLLPSISLLMNVICRLCWFFFFLVFSFNLIVLWPPTPHFHLICNLRGNCN